MEEEYGCSWAPTGNYPPPIPGPAYFPSRKKKFKKSGCDQLFRPSGLFAVVHNFYDQAVFPSWCYSCLFPTGPKKEKSSSGLDPMIRRQTTKKNTPRPRNVVFFFDLIRERQSGIEYVVIYFQKKTRAQEFVRDLPVLRPSAGGVRNGTALDLISPSPLELTGRGFSGVLAWNHAENLFFLL